jgi:hypothetical protein
MQHSNLKNGVLISILAAGVAITTGCSSGTDAPNTTSGAGGSASSGTAGATGTGTAGDGSGTGGSSSGTGGSSSGTSGTVNPGTGGSGGSGNAGPSVCDGTGTRKVALGDTKIDDFEGAMISPGWSSFSDVMPTPNSFKIAQEAPGALGTGHFGHYAGTGAKTTKNGGYGVGTVYNVAIDTKAGIYCIDITNFDGVTFWAKAAKDMAGVNLNFVLPQTNQQDTVNGGGDCVKDSGCFNHPYKSFTLTTDWKQYTAAFSEAGMGKLPTGSSNPGGPAKVTNVIQELVWITLDADWDFSLDEIQFYKGTPPTGPAGGADGGM